MLKERPKEAKAHLRKAQVLMVQQDLVGARASLETARQLSSSGGEGSGGGTAAAGVGEAVREALLRLRALEKEERQRARALFGGTLQPSSLSARDENLARRRAAVLWWLCLPWMPVVYAWRLVERMLRSVLRHAARLVGGGKAKQP